MLHPPPRLLFALPCCALLFGFACGEGASPFAPDAVTDPTITPDAGPTVVDAAPPDVGPRTCVRPAAPADRTRKLLVAHYGLDAQGNDTVVEIFELGLDGSIRTTEQQIAVGRVRGDQTIVFTPDGEIALVALDKGQIAVLRLNEDGPAELVEPRHEGIYVTDLLMAPDGDQVYALSGQWREHGGGIYRLGIGCDGRLIDDGLVAPAKLPYAMQLLDPTRAVVVARDLLETAANGDDVHLLGLDDQVQRLAGADAFGDDEAIVASSALTADGRYLLISDTNIFSEVGGNRVAAVEIDAGALRPAGVLEELPDPAGLLASPVSEVALVLGAEANRITVLDYRPDRPDAPFVKRGPVTTSNALELPIVAVAVERGSLAGRVLVAEATGRIRQLQLDPAGAVDEVGLFELQQGRLISGIGLQP